MWSITVHSLKDVLVRLWSSCVDQAQKEASMVAAKNAEFESLLRNPYQSPVAQRAGFTPVAFPSSPFASTPQPGGNMVFGVPSTPNVGFGQPISPFGVAAGASPQSM
jgi:hypothetical protein